MVDFNLLGQNQHPAFIFISLLAASSRRHVIMSKSASKNNCISSLFSFLSLSVLKGYNTFVPKGKRIYLVSASAYKILLIY
jgi:hypothetical protein